MYPWLAVPLLPTEYFFNGGDVCLVEMVPFDVDIQIFIIRLQNWKAVAEFHKKVIPGCLVL